MRIFILLSALFLISGPAKAQQTSSPISSDSADAVETVERFQTGLADRDSARVDQLLLPDAVIREGGGLETKTEYLGHHFGMDAAFLSELNREVERRRVRTEGRTAWVSTQSRLHGTYEDESLDLVSAELMILRKTSAGWRIAAIHWSSRSRE